MADQTAQNLLRTQFEAAVAVDPMEDTDIETAEDKAEQLLVNMIAGDPAPNNGPLTVTVMAHRGLFNIARVINQKGGL